MLAAGDGIEGITAPSLFNKIYEAAFNTVAVEVYLGWNVSTATSIIPLRVVVRTPPKCKNPLYFVSELLNQFPVQSSPASTSISVSSLLLYQAANSRAASWF